MNTEQLKEEVLKHAQEIEGRKKLSCHRAHVMAEDLTVSLQNIGDICNAEGIKIINCQLGCFGDCSSA